MQVLQPDVIYDVAGNAYVIEMNTNGFMVGSLHKEFFDATLQMRSALEISGVGRCARGRGRGPRRAHGARARSQRQPRLWAAEGGAGWRADRPPDAPRTRADRAPPRAPRRSAPLRPAATHSSPATARARAA